MAADLPSKALKFSKRKDSIVLLHWWYWPFNVEKCDMVDTEERGTGPCVTSANSILLGSDSPLAFPLGRPHQVTNNFMQDSHIRSSIPRSSDTDQSTALEIQGIHGCRPLAKSANSTSRPKYDLFDYMIEHIAAKGAAAMARLPRPATAPIHPAALDPLAARRFFLESCNDCTDATSNRSCCASWIR